MGAIGTDAQVFIKECMKADRTARPQAIDLLNHSSWLAFGKSTLDQAYDGSGGASSRPARKSILDAPLPDAEAVLSKFECMNKLSILEKAAMTAAAHRLPTNKISHLRQAFEKMDRNGDGVLSAHELYIGLSSTDVSSEQLMEILSWVNSDGSNDIEYTEFIAATYQFQKNIQESAVWSVFRIFDQDGSGKICKSEI